MAPTEGDAAGASIPRRMRVAAGRGMDAVQMLSDTVSESLRNRRDPVQVAQRRCAAARHRLVGWSLTALVLVAVSVVYLPSAWRGEADGAEYGLLVLLIGLFVFAMVGVGRAALDLRSRTKALRLLPAAQPSRRPVSGPIRPLLAQLDGYSDALRHCVGMLGIDDPDTRPRTALARRDRRDRRGPGPGAQLRELRDDVLVAADAAEVQLRRQAAEYSALVRVGTVAPDAEVAEVAAAKDVLEQELRAGVDGYGRLVTAAAGVVSANRALSESVDSSRGGDPGRGVAEMTDRLRSLEFGMREILTIVSHGDPQDG